MDFKFCRNIHRVECGRSEQKPMKNVGNNSRGRSQGVPKTFRAPMYMAHCAVIFAIAQLSCWSCQDVMFDWAADLAVIRDRSECVRPRTHQRKNRLDTVNKIDRAGDKIDCTIDFVAGDKMHRRQNRPSWTCSTLDDFIDCTGDKIDRAVDFVASVYGAGDSQFFHEY